MAAVEGLRVDDEGPVRRLTIDRVEVRNALTVAMRLGLADAIVAADADPGVRVVVITGAGGHFCSGADINELERERSPEEAHAYAAEVTQAVFRALRASRTPTVARVEGVAAGAGMGLALGCDIVVAADDARFIASQLAVGIPPDWGAMWLLPRLVGMARAKALLLTGRPTPAAQAETWGLIAACVEAAELDGVVDGYCQALVAAPPLALGLARAGLDRSLDTPLDAFLEWEAGAVALALTDPEHLRRVRAFLERRARSS